MQISSSWVKESIPPELLGVKTAHPVVLKTTANEREFYVCAVFGRPTSNKQNPAGLTVVDQFAMGPNSQANILTAMQYVGQGDRVVSAYLPFFEGRTNVERILKRVIEQESPNLLLIVCDDRGQEKFRDYITKFLNVQKLPEPEPEPVNPIQKDQEDAQDEQES